MVLFSVVAEVVYVPSTRIASRLLGPVIVVGFAPLDRIVTAPVYVTAAPTVKLFTMLVAAETVRLPVMLVSALTVREFFIVVSSSTARVFEVSPPEIVKPLAALASVRLFSVPVEVSPLIQALLYLLSFEPSVASELYFGL